MFSSKNEGSNVTIYWFSVGTDSLSFIRFSTELKKKGYLIKLNSLFRNPPVSSIPQLLERINDSPASNAGAVKSELPTVPDPKPFSLLGANTETEHAALREYIASQLLELKIKPEDVEEATPFVPGQEQMRWLIQAAATLPLWWLSDSYRLKRGVDLTRWKQAWNETFDAEPVSENIPSFTSGS